MTMIRMSVATVTAYWPQKDHCAVIGRFSEAGLHE